MKMIHFKKRVFQHLSNHFYQPCPILRNILYTHTWNYSCVIDRAISCIYIVLHSPSPLLFHGDSSANLFSELVLAVWFEHELLPTDVLGETVNSTVLGISESLGQTGCLSMHSLQLVWFPRSIFCLSFASVH